MKEIWEIVTQNGYTYEFEHRLIANVTVNIVARNEDVAWSKLRMAMKKPTAANSELQ
ncbi:hypothetical protein [Virgibacillus halodenitrificans]|uniref:hypothetical protein n=1 Tax=Virgibacillus halodenitrificans TaxID=1482 RepID=UPI0013CEFFB5|nr:hypothetical protein [Virgibacillus halodenitrificans]